MANLKSYRTILQSDLRPTDQKWEYNVPKLPNQNATDKANLIKSIAFVSSTIKQHVQLHLDLAPSNRVTTNEPLHLFLLLSFSDFRLRESDSNRQEPVQLMPARDSANYIAKLLKSGIMLNGVHYHFFGHSNSQLKSRSCFLYAASKDAISAKVEALGDFSKMKSVGKKVKRIGLLFSSAEMATVLQPERTEDIEDIIRSDYTFTDGCGLISEHFARLVVQRRNIVFRNKRYLPSVFQIRYRGYKGVLTLDKTLKGKTQVQFRDSMRKFVDVKDLSFSVVEFSKPYSFGYLNDEIIILLHALGVAIDVLLRKQTEYLQFLLNVSGGDPQLVFQFLSYLNETQLAERVLMEGVDSVIGSIRKLVKQEYDKMVNKREEQRCRIMIPQSRLLFGVCDPSGTPAKPGRLRPGTCFVRITHHGDGVARTLINTEVLVTRNPCLHPGDLQKFRVVDVPEFAHLVDCIVFPTSGSRPSADLMSGGDLDGDKFFVTWDPDIIPQQTAQPAAYPGVKERIEFEKITDDRRAEFFAYYTNAPLGRVKNLYLKWARLKGVMSAECQQLNRLFSQCVDGNRIKVPQILEDPKEPGPESLPFILDVLHEDATARIRTALNSSLSESGTPADLLDFLCNREDVAMSEFEWIQLVLEKCHQSGYDFTQYTTTFDYSALGVEQKAWLLNSLPPIKNMPNLVYNGLLQSELVVPAELHRFGLEHHNLRWKPIFTSNDRMGRFSNSFCRALEHFHKKLIVFQADERLTLMIYIPQKVAKHTEVTVDDSVRIFGLPRSSGTNSTDYRVTPSKVNSRLYYDEDVLQLYEVARRNTFVFLTRGPQDQSSFKGVNTTQEHRKLKQDTLDSGINYDFRASVALNKISGPIQKHVGRMNRSGIGAAEIYVISNRDVESMRYLDVWLQCVGTNEILPLFDSKPKEYRTQSLHDFDAEKLSPTARSIVFDQKLSKIRDISEPKEVRRVLQILVDSGDSMNLRGVFDELIRCASERNTEISNVAMLAELMNILPQAAFLIQTLLKSDLWREHREALQEPADSIFPILLNALILSTNRLRAFVKQPFSMILKEMKEMSIQQLADCVELIALSVEEPEYAIDLLLECLEPETSRLLSASPTEIKQFTNHIIGVALNHVDEASENRKFSQHILTLQRDGQSDGFEVVKAAVRIDVPEGQPKIGDHVKFQAIGSPQNAPTEAPYAMDALVIRSEQGSISFRCLHRLPSYVEDCSWKYRNCGSFVTSKAAIDALTAFYGTKSACCALYGHLIGIQRRLPNDGNAVVRSSVHDASLNESQNKALVAAIDAPLAFLWGPPGTGKTHTITVILKKLLSTFEKSRFLIVAPTHNAVDNMLQRYITEGGLAITTPLRISTSLAKVAANLRKYTCDAMVGKDLSENFKGRREARNRVKESRLIFTTCVGSALGLLRNEEFDIVLVDEASQQTEPETLIPLTKGCKRAILVGDHVQLRATVQKHAVITGFDVSLFERHYNVPGAPGIAKVMLDTQYRMHPDICTFSSAEFYQGRLQSAKGMDKIQLPVSQFPWPPSARKVFVQCSSTEDLGRQSKANQGQAQLCHKICSLLSTQPASLQEASATSTNPKPSMAILTPYSRQRDALKAMLPGYAVSSIDSFQGREADIVIFVSVRCNAHYDIGFLKDLRRLNVAMTRAKAGVIIIGDRVTLTGQISQDSDAESKAVWKRLLDQCAEVKEAELQP